MKLDDIIKQLNALKKEHGGNLNCNFIGCKSKNFNPINSFIMVYPTLKNGAIDKTKPPVGFWIGDKKKFYFYKKM